MMLAFISSEDATLSMEKLERLPVMELSEGSIRVSVSGFVYVGERCAEVRACDGIPSGLISVLSAVHVCGSGIRGPTLDIRSTSPSTLGDAGGGALCGRSGLFIVWQYVTLTFGC